MPYDGTMVEPKKGRVVPAGMAADILAGLEPARPSPPRVAPPPVGAPSRGGDLALVRRILAARAPGVLAEVEAGLVEAARGEASLVVWLSRPALAEDEDARDPLATATDALAKAASFMQGLSPTDRRAATMLNATSTLAKTCEAIASRRPREPTKNEVEEAIAARADEAVAKICEYTKEAREKLDADRAELSAWGRSVLGPVGGAELDRRVGLMLGEDVAGG